MISKSLLSLIAVLLLAASGWASSDSSSRLHASLRASLQAIQGGCGKGGSAKSLDHLEKIYLRERKKILSAVEGLGEKGIEDELESEKDEKDSGPLAAALVEVIPEALPADHPMKAELVAHERNLEEALAGSRDSAREWARKARTLYADQPPATTGALLQCVEKSLHLKPESY